MLRSRSFSLALIAALAASTVASRAAESDITLVLRRDHSGVKAGIAGGFELSFPSLVDTKGQIIKRSGTPALSADGTTITITYDGGTTCTLKQDGNVAYITTFANLSDNVKAYRTEMLIPTAMGHGGAFAIGTSPAVPFPSEKAPKPFLFQGHGEQVLFTAPSGVQFGFKAPADNSYQEVIDSRHWNSDLFRWVCTTDFAKGQASASFTTTLLAPVSKATVLIDPFGQLKIAQYADKVTSDAELKADVAADESYYGSMAPPARDAFGGLPGSGEKLGLKATGFFSVQVANGKSVLVDPLGNVFFQTGVCGVIPMDDCTFIGGREGVYEWLPPKDGEFATAYDTRKGPNVFSFYLANLIRKFGKPYDADTYDARWIGRLRKLGFNSAGAWSFGTGGVAEKEQFASTPFLPIGGKSIGANSSIWDPFEEANVKKIDEAFGRILTPVAGNPLIIGYFSANEPPLEDVTRIVLAQNGQIAAKRELVAQLKADYPTIEAFNTAWGTSAASLAALADQPLEVKTQAASKDVQKFFAHFLERRYSLVETTFRKYDKNHLLLGDRLTPGTANNRLVVEACGRHVDVQSINYYTYAIEKDFMNRLHEWSGDKPMLLSEFHFTTTDQGFASGHSSVGSQAERGEAYRSYLENAAATGVVVGIQWFEGLDQSQTGRWFQQYSGEATNTGLVNVVDRPYKDFLTNVTAANYDIYDVALGNKPPFVPTSPRLQVGGKKQQIVAIPSLTKPFQNDAGHSEFPGVPPTCIGGDRLVLRASATNFEATYRLAWDKDNLYVYADVVDPTPMKNDKPDAYLWDADAVEIFVGGQQVDASGAPQFSDKHVVLRAAPTPAGKGMAMIENANTSPNIKTIVAPATDGRGYTIKAAIPLAELGLSPKAGDVIRFDIGFNDSPDGKARSRQLMWNGTDRNSRDRGAWGRAQFVP